MPDAAVDNRGASAATGPQASGPPASGTPAAQPSGGGGAPATPPQPGGTPAGATTGQKPSQQVGAVGGRGSNEGFYQQRYQELKRSTDGELAAMRTQLQSVQEALATLRTGPAPAPSGTPAPAAPVDEFLRDAVVNQITLKTAEIAETRGHVAAQLYQQQEMDKYRAILRGEAPQPTAQPAPAQPTPQPAPVAPMAAGPSAAERQLMTPDELAEFIDRRVRDADRTGRQFEIRLAQAGRDVEQVAPGFMQQEVEFGADNPVVPESLRGLKVDRRSAIQMYASETGVADINWIMRNADPAGWDAYQQALGRRDAVAELQRAHASVPAPGGTVPAAPPPSSNVTLPPNVAGTRDSLLRAGGMASEPPKGFEPVRD